MTNEELLNKALRLNKLAERVCDITHTVRAILAAQERCAAIDWDAAGLAHCYAGKLAESAGLLLEDARRDSAEVAATAEGIADEVKAEAHDSPKKVFDEAFPDQGFNPALFSVIVHEHIKHAEAKHPKFADRFCVCEDGYLFSIKSMQQEIAKQVAGGKVCASSLLFEEVYEFLAEVAAGNLEKAKAEAGDVAAVLYRTIKMMEDKQ